MYSQVFSIAIAVAVSVAGHRPCPFPTRVCEQPERFFGTCLKSERFFEEGFSSVLYTMNEEPLIGKPTNGVIVRIVVWPSFKLPTMSRFQIAGGKVTEITKNFHFASRTSLPDVLTSSSWPECDQPLLAKRLQVLKDSRPKGKKELEEDGTLILVEVLEPGKPYRAYFFQDSQDLKLYRDILDVTAPTGNGAFSIEH